MRLHGVFPRGGIPDPPPILSDWFLASHCARLRSEMSFAQADLVALDGVPVG